MVGKMAAKLKTMSDDEDHVWTSTELFKLYEMNGGRILSRLNLVTAVSEHYGSKLLILMSKGLANILIFRKKASTLLRIEEDTDDDEAITNIAKCIRLESKDVEHNKGTYNTRINKGIASEAVSSTFMSLLAKISDKLDYTLPALLIGNIVTSIVQNHYTPLQVALGVIMRDRALIDQAYAFRITCSYYEVLRFKASAALAATKERNLSGVLSSDGALIQAVADNFDANISSQNGLQSTHALAMLLTQVCVKSNDSAGEEETIIRIRKKKRNAG